MRNRLRKIAIGLGWLAGLVLVLAGCGLFVLQTSAFRERVREQMTAALERATGGRVEVGSFTYNWRALSAELNHLVIHGTEAAGSPALFTADSVRLDLQLISFLKRSVDVTDLIVRRPRINVLIRPDRSSNIPTPLLQRGSPIGELIDFKVKHFEIENGFVRLNDENYPLDARGENLSLLLRYDSVRLRYYAEFSSRQMYVSSPCCQKFPFDLGVRAELGTDTAEIQSFKLSANGAALEAGGVFSHFAHPVADFHFKGAISAKPAAYIFDLPKLPSGDMTVDGSAHYDERTKASASGHLHAQNVAFRLSTVTVRKANLASNFRVSGEGLVLSSLTASALGGEFAGRAELKKFSGIELSGRLSGLRLREVVAAANGKPLPWSASMSGPITLSGELSPNLGSFAIQSQLKISPAPGGIPISGEIDLSRGKTSGLRFANSHLDFPSTHLEFSGLPNISLQVLLSSTNLSDLQPAIAFLRLRPNPAAIPRLLPGGSARFQGTVDGNIASPALNGELALNKFAVAGQTWDRLQSQVLLSAQEGAVSSLTLDKAAAHVAGAGRVTLENWAVKANDPMELHADIKNVDIHEVLAQFSKDKTPIGSGMASAALDISGSPGKPAVHARLSLDSIEAYGDRIGQLRADLSLKENELRVERGRLQSNGGAVAFSGLYTHVPQSWRSGQLSVKADSSGFPLGRSALANTLVPGLAGQLQIHTQIAARIENGDVIPLEAGGNLFLHDISAGGVNLGNMSVNAVTRGSTVDTTLSCDLRGIQLHGAAQVGLAAGAPVKGEVRFGRISMQAVNALLRPIYKRDFPVDGFVDGGLNFEGSLQHFRQVRSSIHLDQFEIAPGAPVRALVQSAPAGLSLHNVGPILLEASNGIATVRRFELAGQDTRITVAGFLGYAPHKPINLNVEGSADMQILRLFSRNLQPSGQSRLKLSVRGTVSNPDMTGNLELRNASLFLPDFSNGLSAINGDLTFSGDRVTVEKLTAETGGGHLAISGFVSFAGPPVYHLNAQAEDVRVRYASSISVTADANLRLTGTSTSSLLSGTATVGRVVFTAGTDVGNVLAGFATPVPAPANQRDFATGLHMDLDIQSAPNLQISTALSQDVEAEIDLRLRGTPDRPILLGDIVANQGDIRVFGTRYSINRGEVSFVNSIKIDPVLDLDLQTEARGITVDVSIAGTLSKLNITYRSDPPLQPRDIIALLTVGRAPNTVSNVQNIQVANDTSALQSGANSVLGQAMAPVSNRLSKLFGITNIKIDPLVQGITNTPQARLTLEQQISRSITVTYITNLSQTSEQIFRVEWSLNRQYSIVAVRDDNGEFGIDIQYKRRFK